MADKPRRPGTMSDDERALAGSERRRTAPRGIPIVRPENFEDEAITGNYEGEDLRRMRERRASAHPASRIALLEEEQKEQRADHKELAAIVGETRDHVFEGKAELAGINKTLAGIEKILDRLTQREQAENLDAISARADRRKLWLQLIGAAVGGGVVGKILHALGAF